LRYRFEPKRFGMFADDAESASGHISINRISPGSPLSHVCITYGGLLMLELFDFYHGIVPSAAADLLERSLIACYWTRAITDRKHGRKRSLIACDDGMDQSDR